jgi:hypothetical protein
MFKILRLKGLIKSSINEDLPAPGDPANIIALGLEEFPSNNLIRLIIQTRLRINIKLLI